MYEDSSDEEVIKKSVPQQRIKKFVGKQSLEGRLIVILERASLETVKNGNRFELLNCDKHQRQLNQCGRELNSARPDITHQCLMMLLDSPLNQAGCLQIFIHTERNVLIEVNPQTKVPRTYNRFAGLMVQLLHKLNVRATNTKTKLLKVIKNPVTDYLPSGCRKVGTSYGSEKLVQLDDFAPQSTTPIVFVVGAQAHGSVDVDYVEETVAISKYPLSAALVCAKLCSAFEKRWGVH